MRTVQFRCVNGSMRGSQTHIETWHATRGGWESGFPLRRRRENLDHLHRAGGRFVIVTPRSRLEDAEFRKLSRPTRQPS